MSRIEDVFKRITGAAADSRPASALEWYAREAPRVEEKVSTFIAAGPHAVDPKHPVPQKTPVPSAPAAPVQMPPLQHAHQSEATGESEPPVDSEKLIDVRQLFDYGGFMVRSLRRHTLLALGAFAFAFALTVIATVLMPKTYYIGTKLLAQRNAVMAALSNPGRSIPWDADAPTRAAAETVLRRDNLIALVEKTDLIREWERTRAPVLKLKDWLMTVATRHRPTPEDKLDEMVGQLESKMTVIAGPVGDGTVTIDLLWRDPEMGFRLVQEAQTAFLEARQKAEVDAIAESIRILDDYGKSLHDKINVTLAKLEQTQRHGGTAGAMATAALARASRPLSGPAAPAGMPSLAAALGVPESDGSLEINFKLEQLKTVVTSKRQELARVEGERERQLSDVQTQLTQLTAMYTPTHPSVIATQQKLSALSQPAPQMVALRNEVADLERQQSQLMADAADLQIKAELARRSAAAAAVLQVPTQTPDPLPAPPVAAAPADPTIREMADFASLSLRTQLSGLQNVLERTDSAKIELAVQQAAFKYRYVVIRPAQIPRESIKPNVKLVIGAGLFGSLMLGLLAAVGKDLMSNKILESWQLERQLGLPVLGHLETA